MQRKNVYTFNQIARANLMKIAGDQTLGDTNAGWCYLFAPLRSYLTNPDFLQALYQYKNKYYLGGRPKFNRDFLEAFFGIEVNKLKNDQEASKILDIISTLAISTDKNCLIIDSRKIYNLIHRLQSQYKYDKPSIMMDYLSKCTAIMNESLDTVKHNGMVEFEKIDQYQLQDLENRLNSGECITVGASGNHIYNVYKNNGQYYVTGTNGLNVKANNLKHAITYWTANYQYNYDKKGKLISVDNPFHGYYTLSKGEIYDLNKRNMINEYYRQSSLTPAEKLKESHVQNEKENKLRFLYQWKWQNEAQLIKLKKTNNKMAILKLEQNIQQCVNEINNFVFKEINNNQKLGNLLMELSSQKNPYIGH